MLIDGLSAEILFQVIDLIGAQIFSRVLLETRFWFGAQVVRKSGEASGFIKGRSASIEHFCNELGLNEFSQAPPFPYQVCKVQDAFA